jgi:hypothetical protein
MTKSGYILGLFVALIVLASMFAPAPVSRTVQAQRWSGSGSGSGQSPACEGLRTAYDACTSNGGGGMCGHIAEQLQAHGCGAPSGGGSGSGF